MSEQFDHPGLDLIRRRASAEDFDQSRALSDDDIRALVSDAIRAPSSFNIQHWRFVAVRGAEAKKRLEQAAFGQAQITRAPVVFIVLGDLHGVEKLPRIMQDAVKAGVLADGRARAWVRMAEEAYRDAGLARDEAIRSASLAAMTMMLAAEARGWVSGALTGFDPSAVSREFGIEKRYLPVMLVTVGYPAAPPGPRMPRLSVDEVLTFDGASGGDETAT